MVSSCSAKRVWRCGVEEDEVASPKAASLPGGEDRSCVRCGVCAYTICGALDAQELVELDLMARKMNFGAKDALFLQGEPANKVFNLSHGVARIYKLLPDGRRQVIGFAIQGDFLGLSAMSHHHLSADAITPIAACVFPRPAFARFIEDKIALLRRMNEFVNRELMLAQDRMLLLGRFSAEEKMASFVINWRERLARLDQPTETVALPMSRRDIADYLGLTIETVSRTFTKLERDKVLAVAPGGVRVLNERRAANLAAAFPADV
jgi:CRP/FNR family transcriptional regulator, anaerobic regulatory protein